MDCLRRIAVSVSRIQATEILLWTSTIPRGNCWLRVDRSSSEQRCAGAVGSLVERLAHLKEDPMMAVSRELGVCPEYQKLLSECQEALSSWQQRAALIARNSRVGPKATAELRRLQSNYKRAYTLLDRHEHGCADCQYVAKISGLDFECMSSALGLSRSSA